LNVASDIAPRRFPNQKLGKFLGKLTTMATSMKLLAAAVTFGTGVSAAKRGRGRPWSPYISPAHDLAREWEFITAEPMTTGEALTFSGRSTIFPPPSGVPYVASIPPLMGLKSNQFLRLDRWARVRTKTRSDNTKNAQLSSLGCA
jgi:hypothetical protein